MRRPKRTSLGALLVMYPTRYNPAVDIRQTERFARWFEKLTDEAARARVQARIRRLSLGNPGDVRSVGGGVSELRIDWGPGYRLYFVQRGVTVIVLLAGGDKRTQKHDIRAAIELASSLRGGTRMARVRTRRWDPAEYLRSEKAIVAYLEAALDDGDPALVAAALGDIARARGMSKVARKAGLGRESLYKALSSEGNPRLATVLRVVDAVGLKLHAARR